MQKRSKVIQSKKNPKLSLINFKYIKIIYSRPPSASRTLRDISPMKVLPEAMTKQCLVRCKVRKYYDVNYLLSYDLFIIAFRMKILLFCMRDSISFRQVRINTIISRQCTHSSVVPCALHWGGGLSWKLISFTYFIISKLIGRSGLVLILISPRLSVSPRKMPSGKITQAEGTNLY